VCKLGAPYFVKVKDARDWRALQHHTMIDKWISEAVLAFLRLFIDVEWEKLHLTWWGGAFMPQELRGPASRTSSTVEGLPYMQLNVPELLLRARPRAGPHVCGA
jgi:hypothetical protein